MGPQSKYNVEKMLEKAHTKKENIMELPKEYQLLKLNGKEMTNETLQSFDYIYRDIVKQATQLREQYQADNEPIMNQTTTTDLYKVMNNTTKFNNEVMIVLNLIDDLTEKLKNLKIKN
tara:strand:+ start:1131 stop:1484 length:354 start_codon:yes stop_codon:yes gene_type:complete